MNDVFAPPQSDLSQEPVDLEYAGFWIRVLASIIDTLWLTALILTLVWLVYGSVYFESTGFLYGPADFLISYVLPFVLTVLFWIYKSATPGKMLLSIKIVDAEDAGKVGNGRLAIRYLCYYLSALLLGLGFLWVAWDARKQGWHDKIARTLVIKQR